MKKFALMRDAHEKLFALADDLDQRAKALQRHAGELRRQAHLLEAKTKTRDAVEILDRPDRGVAAQAIGCRYLASEPVAVLKLVKRFR